MAIKTSGSLAMSEIAAEFGDATPYSLSEFYRGGGKVPNVSQNNAVPLSGAIAIGNFYGAVNQWTTYWSTAWNTSATTSQTTTTAWSTAWSTSTGVITEGPYYRVDKYSDNMPDIGIFWLTYSGDDGIFHNYAEWTPILRLASAGWNTSYSLNGYTYYRGNFVRSVSNWLIFKYYQIYRTYNGSRTTSATTSQSTSTAWSTAWSTSQTTSKLTP